MRAVAFLLAFVSSAFAYSVLVPNGSQGWTNQGSQPLSWQRVDTDRQNFTALLINQSVNGFNPQILAAQVDGTLGQTKLNPPSGGWPTGSHFRINLVQDPNNLNTILAQSPEFSISESTSTISSTGKTTVNTGTATAPIVTQSDSGSGSITDPITVPTSAAMPVYSVQTGLLALFSLVGFALA